MVVMLGSMSATTPPTPKPPKLVTSGGERGPVRKSSPPPTPSKRNAQKRGFSGRYRRNGSNGSSRRDVARRGLGEKALEGRALHDIAYALARKGAANDTGNLRETANSQRSSQAKRPKGQPEKARAHGISQHICRSKTFVAHQASVPSIENCTMQRKLIKGQIALTVSGMSMD